MKTDQIHTILGAGGTIGKELAVQLNQLGKTVRVAGRNPTKVNTNDEVVVANAFNLNEVRTAVKGSEVVYLTLGLQYNIKVWQHEWPQIMDNTIIACQENGARLVFFDNVYMYGKVAGWMTEETPFNPCSKKGEVRAKIASKLLREMNKGNIQALIARSADFYGAEAVNTFVLPMVFTKLKSGGKANWLGNDKVAHSMTYAPDASKAVALLGTSPEAFGQTWHLPTHRDALNGQEFIREVAAVYGVKPNYSNLSRWMMHMAGWFNPLVKESIEMMYQYEFEYLFSSSKFENAFFAPVSYHEGILATAKGI
ncbi:MAG: NAD-dependent epimerase/dehydratase family protein [Bacteroidales bacterium]|nr:NAD-dependent epimerase/dehydratase family protein [Bacteroidales bacterium]